MKQNLQIVKIFILTIFMLPGIVSAQAIKDSIRKNYTQQDYKDFLLKKKRGEVPGTSGLVSAMRAGTDVLVNNNGGSTATSNFTQSETSVIAFGSNVVIGFNDSGSRDGNANKFTGWSYSSDGGSTFTDGGTLPDDALGDAGDAVLARDETTERIYFSTLGFTFPNTIQVFNSDDNGVTWSAPANGTPGGNNEDKQWIVVDNFAGTGNGNVYLISRRFGGPSADRGIYVFYSTDNGATYLPDGGVKIASSGQGSFVAVAPNHDVYVFWMDASAEDIQMRTSTDFGVTFGTAVTVVSGLSGPQINNGLSLTGQTQGTASYSGFRSNSFPHAAINPVSGQLYVVYNDNPAGADKADVFMITSEDSGATWSTPTLINDDGTTTDQWQPTLAVTPDGNNLGVFYYSREGDATDNNLLTFNGRVAEISGTTLTFSASIQISDVQSLPEFGRDAPVVGTYMGDYNTVYATNTDFHLVWADNRDNLPDGGDRKDPNVYYKSIPIGNTPPVALCMSVSVSADANCQAVVTADQVDDGSNDPDGDPITLSLSPAGPYALGVTNVTLTVEDDRGGSSTCTTTITVTDNTAPVAPLPPAGVNVQCASDVPALVDLTAFDNCDGDITVSPTVDVTPGSSVNDFEEVRTWTFTDLNGNTSSVSQTITVFDDIPPVLIVISEPITLWPPNHKYQSINISELFISVADNCSNLTIGDVYITSVSSDEEEDAKGNGDGKTSNDIVIESSCTSVDLRKERNGNGNGRVYTIKLAVNDENGNTGIASCQVHVPHSNKKSAIDDGLAYFEECDKSSLITFQGDDIQLMNYPNPFNGNTNISFIINETNSTTLKVYDTYGKQVATLFEGRAEEGQQYTIEFSAGNLPKGMYVYHLQSGNDVSVVKKMILMK